MDTTDNLDLRALAFTTPLAVLAAAGHGLSLSLEAPCPACGCGLFAHDALISAPVILTAGDVIPGHVTCDLCSTHLRHRPAPRSQPRLTTNHRTTTAGRATTARPAARVGTSERVQTIASYSTRPTVSPWGRYGGHRPRADHPVSTAPALPSGYRCVPE